MISFVINILLLNNYINKLGSFHYTGEYKYVTKGLAILIIVFSSIILTWWFITKYYLIVKMEKKKLKFKK